MKDFDMKATRCQRPSSPHCNRTAPQAFFEVLHLSLKGWWMSGWIRMGASQNFAFVTIHFSFLLPCITSTPPLTNLYYSKHGLISSLVLLPIVPSHSITFSLIT